MAHPTFLLCFTSALAIFGLLSPLVAALPSVERSLGARTPSLPLKVNIVHTFAFPSWCENLAVQANGRILVSRLDTPEVIQVDPNGVLAPITVATFNATTYKGCLGISETTAGVFYVITSAQVDEDFVKTSGINSIWQINMNTFSVDTTGNVLTPATVTKLVDIPDADFLNGMTTLDNSNILVGDIFNGWVYKINTVTAAYSIAINDPLMKFPVGAGGNLGVNGLKIKDSHLYWTNTANGTFNRIQINSAAEPIGRSQIVSANVPKADDFVFKNDGTAFIAANQADDLSVLLPGQNIATVVAGSSTSTVLAGVTAGKFGRLSTDCDRLYLTTSGGLAAPINGTVMVAGSVVYVDTKGF